MASTETFICNQALGRLGGARIMSLNDQTKEAEFCTLFFAQTRDEVLRSHHWNFAATRAKLTKSTEPPPFEWLFRFRLPTDFLRLVQINGYGCTDPAVSYEIESGWLLTNEEDAYIRYIRKVDDSTTFDPLFTEAMAVKLASKLARPLCGDQNLPNELLGEYERITAPLARRVDAQENRRRPKQPWVESAFVRARGGGGDCRGGSSRVFITAPTQPNMATGNVIGPASAEDGVIVVFQGADGKKIKANSQGLKVSSIVRETGYGFVFSNGRIDFDTNYIDTPSRTIKGEWNTDGGLSVNGETVLTEALVPSLEMKSMKNVSLGYAGLDSEQKVSLGNLPNIPASMLVDVAELDIVGEDGIEITVDGDTLRFSIGYIDGGSAPP